MATISLGLHFQSATRQWKRYNNALKHSPLATKSLTCMAAYSIGDLAAQISFSKQPRFQQKLADIDALRTLRMALYGALWCGPAGHHFYAGLDKVFEARPLALSIAGKVGLDQALYAPISTAIFFAWANIASGTAGNTRADLTEKFAPSVKAAWALWVPAMTINMALVPPAMRILFINATAIVWTMVLSSMADTGAAPDTVPAPLTDPLSLVMASESVALFEPPAHEELEPVCDDGFVSSVWQKLMRGGSAPPAPRKSADAKPLAYLFEWPSLVSAQSEVVPNRALRSVSTFSSMRNVALLDDDLGVGETPNGEDGECGPFAGSCELHASQNIVDVLEECLP